MGKTFRHEAEFGEPKNYIRRGEARRFNAQAQKLAGIALCRELPKVKTKTGTPEVNRGAEAMLTVHPVWVPAKEAEESSRLWFLRETRLDLLQTIGEQLLGLAQ